MPQFFGPADAREAPDRAPSPLVVDRGTGSARRDPYGDTHAALVAAPDLRSLDEALVWMARVLVDHLRFDRVMVLRTGTHHLALTGTAFSEQPDLALEAQHNAERHPVELRADSLEREMMRRRAPALVVPVGDARAWHPITDQLRTPAYVAAPVEAFGRTVATLHADAHFAGRRVDATDRVAIGVFAQACRSVTERALLVEEIERLRASARRNAEHLLALTAPDPVENIGSAVASIASPDDATVPEAHPALTPRENEVLALMSRGATSQEIARRLVLSSGTVKTHARGILRKLGASTRAEAVAVAFGPRRLDDRGDRARGAGALSTGPGW